MSRMEDVIRLAIEDHDDALTFLDSCINEDEEDYYGDTNYEKYEYCKDYVESIKEMFEDIIDALEVEFEMEESDSSDVLQRLSETYGVQDYSDLYIEVSTIRLETKYNIITGDLDHDFETLGVNVENMLTILRDIEWGEEDAE